MKIPSASFAALTLLAAALPCWAAQWFAVGGPREPAATMVEVDLDSLGSHAAGGEAVIRVSYSAPQAHAAGFSYGSFVANARFDCEARSIALTSAAYFALPRGNGRRVGREVTGSGAALPRALVGSIPADDRLALLRATCARRPVS